jgi:predicted metal-dependent phosphoesterase TrpH
MILSTANLHLTPDSPIDLQTHTVHSDGTWTLEGLIDHFVGQKFGLAAITDHDRLDMLEQVQGLAIEKGMPILPAVEMTCAWKGEMTDVLCFGVSPHSSELKKLTADVLQRQRENTSEVYENLRRQNFVFPEHPQELNAILETPGAQQPRALVALLNKYNYGTAERSAGKILMEAGCTYATNEIAAVVEAAHRDGALCLLAHPGRSDGFVCYDETLLDQVRSEAPLDGLEVHYPLHTAEQIEMYGEYAKKHALLTSCGSDSHGPQKEPIGYAAKLSRDLLERLGIQLV